MVKILDRYVFLETFKYFLLSLAVFLVLFFIIDFVSNIELGIKEGVKYVFFRIPLYAVRLIPIAVLIAVMTVLSNLSASRELTVIKALGISLYRLSIPILFFAALISIGSFLINEFITPKTTISSKEIKYKVKKKKNLKFIGNSIWFKGKKNSFVFIERLDTKSFKGERVSIFTLNTDFSPTKRIDASSIEYVSSGIWKLKNGFERNLISLRSKSFKEKEINLGIDRKDLILERIEPDTLSAFPLFKI